MALPHLRPVTQHIIGAYLADVSTAGSAWVVSPWKGHISKVYSVLEAAITVGDATWTVEIGGAAVDGISVTIANSGSAAGTVDSGTPSTPSDSFVTEGQAIEFVNAAGSTGTVPVRFYAVIDRD